MSFPSCCYCSRLAITSSSRILLNRDWNTCQRISAQYSCEMAGFNEGGGKPHYYALTIMKIRKGRAWQNRDCTCRLSSPVYLQSLSQSFLFQSLMSQKIPPFTRVWCYHSTVKGQREKQVNIISCHFIQTKVHLAVCKELRDCLFRNNRLNSGWGSCNKDI